jgi:hypothetical protein
MEINICKCEYPKIPENSKAGTICVCGGAWKPTGRGGPAPVKARYKIDRNGPCHCGSGIKYKKCHMPQDIKFHNVYISFQQAKRDRQTMENYLQRNPGDEVAKARLVVIQKYITDTQPWITKYEHARKDVQ